MMSVIAGETVDNLIISQGSMLASGARKIPIPGTPSASGSGGTRSNGVGKSSSMLVTAAGSPSADHTVAVNTSALRRSSSTLVQANKPTRYAAPAVNRSGGGKGPSTFMQKVLGGHLPMSWLTASSRG